MISARVISLLQDIAQRFGSLSIGVQSGNMRNAVE
jgi:hypothetical protein